MGKIRNIVMGDVEAEEAQKKRADARRETKKFKKQKIEGVNLKGGERTAVVEGTDIRPEFKKLINEVEQGETPAQSNKKAKIKEAVVRTRSKKYLRMRSMVDYTKMYALIDAVKLVKKTSFSKFDGTVELHINVNPKSLQTTKKESSKDIRGTVSLPHGTGKQVRVVEATEAVLSEIESGKINFDVLVARPSMMPKLAKFARTLGPKGLMPNPKNGTVTEDIDKKIKELSAGLVNFKSEPENPIIHMPVGKVSFEDKKLVDNINAVLDKIGRGKISKVSIAATMGPGVRVDFEK